MASSVASLGENEFFSWLSAASLASPAYRLLVRRFGGFHDAPSETAQRALDYHDGLFSDISHSFAALDSTSLLSRLQDTSNPWLRFARDHVIPLIEETDPALLGISVVAVNQVVPAFSIGMMARSLRPDLPICFGGAWVTQLRDRLAAVPWLKEFKFFFVPFQGEAVLSEMAAAILSGAATSAGLCSQVVWGTGRQLPLNSLPTPEFDDLSLDAYGEPGHLPLMASRGCYWAKCKFCSYPVLEPLFEVRDQPRLASDMERLAKAYRARHIAFVDPSISSPLARRIATTVLEKRLEVSWGGFARLEGRFTRDLLRHLRDGGCSVVYWGLESGSPRVQESICKGISLDTARRVLESSAEAGIHNRVLMMYGLPNETDTDLESSLSFVEENLHAIHSICWNHYAAEEGTPFGSELIRLDPSARAATDLSIGVRLTSSLSPSFLQAARARMSMLAARIDLNGRQLRMDGRPWAATVVERELRPTIASV